MIIIENYKLRINLINLMNLKQTVLFGIFLMAIAMASCEMERSANTETEKVVSEIDSLIDAPLDTKVNIEYAQGFSVENHKNYQRLVVHNPWDKESDLAVYILVSKEYAQDVKLKENEVLIQVPVDRVAIMSASNIGYFELLEELDLIKALADAKRLYNPDLRLGVELGSVKVLGNSAAINTEELLLSNCDIFIQTAYESGSNKDQALIDGGVKVIYNIDWMEETPLARAEWIKFVGLLVGENKRANSVFSTIEENYTKLKKMADTISYKPDVLVGGLYKDVWYMPGGESFKAHLLKDAGTNYRWAADSTKGSLALSFETVLEQQMNAAVWVEVPFKRKKDLLVSDERYQYFDAFKIGALYHNMKRSNESGGNDYWEKGLCRPDELLEDLIRIFHAEEMDDGELKYYERVKE